MAIFLKNKNEITLATQCIEQFCEYNNIKIGIKQDASKTAIMEVNGNIDENEQYKIQNQTIPILEKGKSYKYLGVHLNKDLNTKDAADYIISALNKVCIMIKSGGWLSNQQIEWLANRVIWPVAEYRMRVMQFTKSQCDKMTKIIRKSIRLNTKLFDLPNAYIHGNKNHIMEPLGIYDGFLRQKAIYLNSTLKLILNCNNPGKDWFEFLILAHSTKTPELQLNHLITSLPKTYQLGKR